MKSEITRISADQLTDRDCVFECVRCSESEFIRRSFGLHRIEFRWLNEMGAIGAYGVLQFATYFQNHK